MKVSLHLLRKFVDIRVSADKLAEILTERAFEVETVEHIVPKFSGVIAARVAKIESHPNADRLRVITLSTGSKTISPVVCGAFNFTEGDMVPLALPGAVIPHNIHSDTHEQFVLGRTKIRGVESNGMICAAFELAVADSPGEGILVLDASIKPGTDLAVIFPSDTIFDLALPANRPDLFSHIGVAREISAVLGTNFKSLKPTKTPFSSTRHVSIKEKKLCRAFYLAELEVAVGPSPQWLQHTLTNLGMRPVNTIVDITNYVMAETGQPTHAFDADQVQGEMVVRRARAKEKLTTLDHIDRELDPDILVIADQKKALDVAGVMGGKESEITEQTVRIAYTAANFDAQSVRNAARKLSLRSPASSLYEKGLRPSLAYEGFLRSIQLMKELAGANIETASQYAIPETKPQPIVFSVANVNTLVGTNFSTSQIKKIFGRYGITVTGRAKLSATPPPYRSDLKNIPDLAEEVLKFHGINKIKAQPFNIPTARNYSQDIFPFNIRNTKQFWSRLGYNEVQNYSFVSEKDIKNFKENPADYLPIANPLSKDQAYLKRHLLIPLLKNIRSNQKEAESLRLFEVGKKYVGYGKEPVWLYAVMADKNQNPQKSLNQLKGDVLQFLHQYGISDATFSVDGELRSHIIIRGRTIGHIGMVDPDIQNNFDIDHEVLFAELAVGEIYNLSADITYQPHSKFPAVSRDISLILDAEVTWSDIEKIVRSTSSLLADIELFEASFLAQKDTKKFHAGLAAKDQKNLGIRLVFQAPDRTLKDDEIAGILEQIVLKLQKELKAEVR